MSKKWTIHAVDGDWAILKFKETDEWFRACATPIATEDLIDAFKQTKIFKNLIDNKAIAIYVVGSRTIGLDKPTSDLDLIVIVDDHEIDTRGKVADTRLSYKGVAVHWKFYDYRELFYIDDTADKLAVFRQQICYKQPIPVYLDNRGKKLNDYLVSNSKYLTEIGAKLVAFSYKNEILCYKDRPLQKADIRKTIYHLAMASEILSGKSDLDFLFEVKYAVYKDYESLISTGLMNRLTDAMHMLVEYTANIGYDILKKQTDAINMTICSLIADIA